MIPQFSDKHAHESLITPSKMLLHRREYGRLPTATVPQTVILCFQGRFMTQVLEKHAHTQCDGCFSKLFFLNDHPTIAIGEFGIGAPAAAAKLEELIAWGVKQFIAIGTAGSLQSKLGIGDIVLCEKAIRDEGTSYHYIPASRYIHAPRRMTNRLHTVLKKSQLLHFVGSSWTTDSFYRQTAEEVTHYQKEGVLSVEMEAAALFAVAHFHQVDLGALFTISDSHADLNWQPHLEDERPRNSLHQMLQIALSAAIPE